MLDRSEIVETAPSELLDRSVSAFRYFGICWSDGIDRVSEWWTWPGLWREQSELTSRSLSLQIKSLSIFSQVPNLETVGAGIANNRVWIQCFSGLTSRVKSVADMDQAHCKALQSPTIPRTGS